MKIQGIESIITFEQWQKQLNKAFPLNSNHRYLYINPQGKIKAYQNEQQAKENRAIKLTSENIVTITETFFKDINQFPIESYFLLKHVFENIHAGRGKNLFNYLSPLFTNLPNRIYQTYEKIILKLYQKADLEITPLNEMFHEILNEFQMVVDEYFPHDQRFTCILTDYLNRWNALFKIKSNNYQEWIDYQENLKLLIDEISQRKETFTSIVDVKNKLNLALINNNFFKPLPPLMDSLVDSDVKNECEDLDLENLLSKINTIIDHIFNPRETHNDLEYQEELNNLSSQVDTSINSSTQNSEDFFNCYSPIPRNLQWISSPTKTPNLENETLFTPLKPKNNFNDIKESTKG